MAGQAFFAQERLYASGEKILRRFLGEPGELGETGEGCQNQDPTGGLPHGDHLCETAKFGDASDLHPLDDEDVAVVIEAGSVRAHEATGGKRFPGLCPYLAPGGADVLPQLRDNPVVGIHQCDTPVQFRYQERVLPDIEVAWIDDAVHEAVVLAI